MSRRRRGGRRGELPAIASIRGYGGSTLPAASEDHETSSKRAMARDAMAVMRHVGFDRFDVAVRVDRPTSRATGRARGPANPADSFS